MKDQTANVPHIDCLQSAFSLKIRLVLISARLQTTTLRYNEGLVSSLLFFLLGLTPSFIAAWVFWCSNFAKKNKRLLAVYSPQDGTFVHYFLLNIPLLTKNTSDHKRPPPSTSLSCIEINSNSLPCPQPPHDTKGSLQRAEFFPNKLSHYPVSCFVQFRSLF